MFQVFGGKHIMSIRQCTLGPDIVTLPHILISQNSHIGGVSCPAVHWSVLYLFSQDPTGDPVCGPGGQEAGAGQ